MKILKSYFIIAVMLLSITQMVSSQNVDDQAPDFTLNVLNGSTFTLSEQQDKVVFMFLFGWNCFHCKANGPNTQSDIYEVFKDNENFVAVGVETWDGSSSGTQSFINITGLKYPVLLTGSSVLSKYKTTYDRIIVVDQQGVIKYKSTDVANKTITAEASSVIQSLLDTPTSIDRNSKDDKTFIVAPNPVGNQLILKNLSSYTELPQVTIYNSKGQAVLDTKLYSEEENSIDVSNLLAGLYTVRITTDTDTFTEKFLKTD